MAIPVAAAAEPTPVGPVSGLERAFARAWSAQDPVLVWADVATELDVAGFRHASLDDGPELQTLDRDDVVLGVAGRVAVHRVKAAQLAERRAYADGLVAVAELAALVESRRPFEGSGAGVVPAEWVAQVVAVELGISTPVAMERLGRAWALSRLPRVLAALQGGWLGVGAVHALVGAMAGVAEARLDEVEAAVFDTLGGRRLPEGSSPLGSWSPDQLYDLRHSDPDLAGALDTISTPGWVRARCRPVVRRLDPEALRRQVKAARSGREVRVWDAEEPGMAWLALRGTQAEVAACFGRIDAEARDRHRHVEAEELVDPATGELPTLANTRADVLVDHVLGPRPDGTPGPPVNLTVHLVTDPPDARADDHHADGGDGDLPGGQVRVDGLGDVVRDALDELVRLAQHSGRGPLEPSGTGRVVVRKVRPVTCPGHPEGIGPGPYRPDVDLAAQVVARDVTCRFPGCVVPAQSCDLDHCVPWPAGPTCLCNLNALCRRHHRVKTHHPGWRLINHGVDGRLTWTMPTGRTVDTHPGRGSPGDDP